MKTIIVSTDFSPAATNAVDYAAELAMKVSARLILFNIYEVPIAVTDAPLMLLSVDDLRQTAERRLNELKQSVEQATSGKIEIGIETKMGDVVDELAATCERLQPFLVVMGTTGHSAVERTIFGSISLSTIRHLTWPIICVPMGKNFGAGIRRVGLACDFREDTESTPTSAIRFFIRELKAELLVLNVDKGHGETKVPDLLLAALDDLAPTYHVIQNKDVEEGINQFAEQEHLDLVITIPRKHKLLEGLFRKSSTKQLVFESQVPIMCVHA